MKFTITRAKLLDALQTVQNVVAARSSLQILSNALIRAEEGKLWITTTDLDMTVRSSVEAEIEETGHTTLPIRRVAGIVRELPEGLITFCVDEDDVAVVQCGPSFFRINGLSMRAFPPMPVTDGRVCYRMERAALREMLRKTSYAASMDETRRILNGVLMAFKDGKLTMVATDGRRLALVEHEVEFPVEAEAEMVLPNKAVNELQHILGIEGDLKMHAQKNQIVFEFGQTMMSSKLIDGIYPNYRQVIPASCGERISVEREVLLAALRRTSLIMTDKSNATRLTFADNQLTLTITSPDVGEARETLAIKYGGKSITVVFNPEYLMDPLRNLDSDEVHLEMNDGHSPVILKSDIPFLYVLMPLRIS